MCLKAWTGGDRRGVLGKWWSTGWTWRWLGVGVVKLTDSETFRSRMNELDGWSQWALALRTQVEGAEVQVVFLAATLFEMTASPLLAGFFFFPFFGPCSVAHGIFVPHPGMEPRPSTVEAWSLNHWTTREAPGFLFLWFTNMSSVSKNRSWHLMGWTSCWTSELMKDEFQISGLGSWVDGADLS